MVNQAIAAAVFELAENKEIIKSMTPTLQQTGDTYLQINLPQKNDQQPMPQNSSIFGRELTQKEKTGLVITLLGITAVALIYRLTR